MPFFVSQPSYIPQPRITVPVSYAHHYQGPIDLDPVLSRKKWNNPIWATFPTDFHQINPNFVTEYPAAKKGMGTLPLILGLSLLGSLEAANSQGNRLKEKYYWKQIDFTFPTPKDRADAIATGKFIPSNNLPLGLEVWNGRTFVTLPKWKPGVPATLAVIPKNSEKSPLLQPYPNWNWHNEGNCNGLTSVFRLSVDPCGRLWVLDSGVIDVLNTTTKLCPSQIVVFDLRTDKLIWRYRIPKEQIQESSLFTNIITDVRNGKCDEAFAYITDVFRYAIVVYNWKEDRSWRVSHNFFYPDPIACKYSLDDITFRWTDGVFGLALSPVDGQTGDRNLYFHPMSSFREFTVPASILRNDTADDHPEEFKVLGESRGIENRHSSASGMDRKGILFYNLVTQDAVGCWNSNKPYKRIYQGTIPQNKETLNFPNDLKIDLEKRQSVWVLSNRLHKYLYTNLDPEEINFRILTGRVDDVIRGTVCDPKYEGEPEVEDRSQCNEEL